MSNIVERLRYWSKPDKFGNREGRADDFVEAADLIDRLRAALKAARPYVEYCAEASKAAAAALREIDAMAAVRDGG